MEITNFMLIFLSLGLLVAVVLLINKSNDVHLAKLDIESAKLENEDLNYYRDLVNGCFDLSMNMNDTFEYACADCERLDVDHIMELRPIYEQYQYYAFIAYASIKRNQLPLPFYAEKQYFKDAVEEIKNTSFYDEIKHDQ